MIELETTYLAKYLPERLESCKAREILDVYLPKTAAHPVLRLRKSGERYEMTKKAPVEAGDASRQEEQTIRLAREEFDELAKLEGKRLRKIRYYYPCRGKTAEIDVFQDALRGLVLVDFEFETQEEKEAFATPEFCLADVTQEEFVAGGMLCGKSYADIEGELRKFGYSKS